MAFTSFMYEEKAAKISSLLVNGNLQEYYTAIRGLIIGVINHVLVLVSLHVRSHISVYQGSD